MLSRVSKQWDRVWELLCVASVVVMNDAPLRVIVPSAYEQLSVSTLADERSFIREDSSDPSSDTMEWPWASRLLALEGCTILIRHLLSLSIGNSELHYQELGELVRFACHVITFTYQDTVVNSIQILGLTLLDSIMERYSTVQESETGHCLLEQYETQILAALRRVIDEGIHEDTVLRALVILFNLLAKKVITREDMAMQAIELLYQRPQVQGLANIMQRHVQQKKLFLLSQLYRMCVVPLQSGLSKSVQKVIVKFVNDNQSFWKQHWFATIETIFQNQSQNHRLLPLYLLNASTMLESVESMERVVFLLSCAFTFLLDEEASEEDVTSCILSLTLITPHLFSIDNSDIVCEVILYMFQELRRIYVRFVCVENGNHDDGRRDHDDAIDNSNAIGNSNTNNDTKTPYVETSGKTTTSANDSTDDASVHTNPAKQHSLLLHAQLDLFFAMLDLMVKMRMNTRFQIASSLLSDIRNFAKGSNPFVLADLVVGDGFVEEFLLDFKYHSETASWRDYQSVFQAHVITTESQLADTITKSFLDERFSSSSATTPLYNQGLHPFHSLSHSVSPLNVNFRGPSFESPLRHPQELDSPDTEFFSDSEASYLSLGRDDDPLSPAPLTLPPVFDSLELEPLKTQGISPPLGRDSLQISTVSLTARTPRRIRDLGFHFSPLSDSTHSSPCHDDDAMTQSVGTPSHFYHRSLFSSRHRVVNRREMKEAFCYPLNCVIFGFVTHVLSDYATEEQMECFRRVLAFYQDNEDSAFLILTTYYHLWILPTILRERRRKKQLLRFLLELIQQHPHWGDTLPGEVATQLVVLLKRSAGERSPANDVYLETLWTTLLLLYKRSPEQVFVFVLTTMTQFLAVSMELGDASYLALTTRLLSGLAALRAHDRQLLMEYYDKSLIVMLPGRLAIMNADALVAVVRFVQTFFVSNGLASRTPLLTRLGIGMAKQCLALQHRDVTMADKHTCKEVVYSLGYLFLLMAKEAGNRFKKVLVQYSATDQSVVHYCCQQYARRKRRDRFRLRRKKPLVVDSSNFVY